MIIKNKAQRVGVLIDVQNLYYSAKNLYQSHVNFQEILKQAIDGRSLIRAFAYVVKTKTQEEKTFFEALIKLGIETKIKELQEYYGGAKKADWDVGITVDAIKMISNTDVIVIASGDGDFTPLVEYLKNQGRRVEIIAFGRSTSSLLKQEADEFIDIDKTPKKYLLKK
ncbi:MAG TPA: NYN domain-containing protein [Candidatus Pacearchaeota archaeon]|nr:NYN domain-containing protein [Candidatus Paceibacterota bacterium]HOK00639.1 NYN domain-containing protein [Candidatus Pacearchaeota archaeon]HOL90598.1 NYN domain-containing protein [Candidatus Pacearchaeota archaeon]HPO68146.1 NYN domain-containing protein [Candidatus Pacearchaeota archaeon]